MPQSPDTGKFPQELSENDKKTRAVNLAVNWLRQEREDRIPYLLPTTFGSTVKREGQTRYFTVTITIKKPDSDTQYTFRIDPSSVGSSVMLTGII